MPYQRVNCCCYLKMGNFTVTLEARINEGLHPIFLLKYSATSSYCQITMPFGNVTSKRETPQSCCSIKINPLGLLT